MIKVNNKKGFTLIEAIIFIIIVSIGFTLLFAIYISILPKSYRSEYINVATALCEKKVEEIMASPYSAISTFTGTNTFPSPFEKYQYTVTSSNESSYVYVDYIDPNFLDPNLQAKRVIVSVNHLELPNIKVSSTVIIYDLDKLLKFGS